MSTIERLAKLNDSWTQYFAKNPSENAYSKLSNVSLVNVEGQFIFAKTPERSFLETITDTAPIESCFKTQLRKVRLLLSDVDPTTLNEEKAKAVKELSERINRLGRHIFVSKQGTICAHIRRWLFGIQENILDYQIEHQEAIGAPTQIQQGLPNKNSVSCWLNASLMYLTCTSLYDPLLSTQQSRPSQEVLRKSLHAIVSALRAKNHTYIIESLYNELLRSLKNSKFSDLLEGEQDASEFLLRLQNHFALRKEAEQIKQTTIYTSDDAGIYKKTKDLVPSSRLMIRPPQTGETIDIQALLDEQSQKNGITHYEIADQDPSLRDTDFNDEKAPKNFYCQDVCVQLPDSLEVYIERGHFNKEVQDATVPRQSLVAPNGYIELNEYRLISQNLHGKERIVGKEVKTRCKYQIVAAIEHKGDYASFGHYVTLARAPDGKTITCYDDQTLHTTQDESVWQNAYLLQLKIVERNDVAAM